MTIRSAGHVGRNVASPAATAASVKPEPEDSQQAGRDEHSGPDTELARLGLNSMIGELELQLDQALRVVGDTLSGAVGHASPIDPLRERDSGAAAAICERRTFIVVLRSDPCDRACR